MLNLELKRQKQHNLYIVIEYTSIIQKREGDKKKNTNQGLKVVKKGIPIHKTVLSLSRWGISMNDSKENETNLKN